MVFLKFFVTNIFNYLKLHYLLNIDYITSYDLHYYHFLALVFTKHMYVANRKVRPFSCSDLLKKITRYLHFTVWILAFCKSLTVLFQWINKKSYFFLISFLIIFLKTLNNEFIFFKDDYFLFPTLIFILENSLFLKVLLV